MGARRLGTVLGVVLCLAVAGCDAATDEARPPSTSPSATATATLEPSPEPSSPGPTELGPPLAAGSSGTHEVAERTFEVAVPASYDATTPAPLVMLLHGFGSSAAEIDAYLGLRTRAEERGILYVVPEGTVDSGKRRFWNATEACCDFGRSQVDDSGYLASVLRGVAGTYAVDPSRVVVVGHSNGGFMAYRLACDHPELVTHAVSLAGAMPIDQAACAPSEPVSVLQVHGTADPTIRYDGGSNGPFPYPSALASIQAWARLNGCSTRSDETPEALDLDAQRAGAETSITTFPECDGRTSVELWSIDGAGHVPTLADGFADAVLDLVVGD